MDLRFAIRSLRKNPGFTLLAVLVMAVGIGANTAVFSVVNAVLLKPLRYRDPDRIVTLSPLWKKGTSGGPSSAPDFHDWHDQSSAFTAMSYYHGGDTAVRAREEAEYAGVALIAPEFFQVFAAEPALGRFFLPEEERKGGMPVAVISYAYWQRHFGGNAQVLGQSIRAFDHALTVVGVAPPGFVFPNRTDLWAPTMLLGETSSRSGHNYRVIGRLKKGVSLEQAQTQMTSIGARLEQQYPAEDGDKSVAVVRMQDAMVGGIRKTLYLLLGAVGVVLLIACANMANLLLAKATARTREIAIRAAVGASRRRIIRQLITESLVLALLSGAVGLVVAIWGADALVAAAPADVPRLAETTIDGWVLGFTFATSVVASLVFGLAPALAASRIDLNDALKQGGTRSVLGGGTGALRGAMVVAEIALSVVLLAGAALLIRSFIALHNVTLGYRPEKVLVMETSIATADDEGARRASLFYKQLLARVAALPRVLASGAVRGLPGRVGSAGAYWIEGGPGWKELGNRSPQAVFTVTAPGYFGTMGIPLLRGRDFNERDTVDAPFVAIINEALAKKSFPNEDPIGKRIQCGLDSPEFMTIVGMTGDVREWGPGVSPWPEIYMPFEQHSHAVGEMSLVVRTPSAPGSLAETLRRTVRGLSPDVPVRFTTMDATLAESVAAPRFRTLLLGIFAAVAMCLAMAGVYGVMAYVVGQRSNEIGLRMALGASTGDVLRLVLGQGLVLAAIGLALVLAGAAAASRLLTTMLFEVKPTDPMTYVAVAAVLAIVALAASYVPARRAAAVDPLVALRQE